MPAAISARRRKALGQHFLIDGRVADRQVGFADLQPDEAVLEVGPGTGVLTRRIAPRVHRLVAIEKDPALARTLRTEFGSSPHVEIVEADATDFAYESLGPIHKIVANLPYSVSTPITFRLFSFPWEQAILMYQKEFADRLVAEVGTRDYGRLSAARAYFAAAEPLETVSRGAFQPPPQVASGIVRLRRHRTAPFPVANPDYYLELVRILFSTRRKTLRATLVHQYAQLGLPTSETADQVLEAWGRGSERPERVAPADLGRLSLLLWDARGHE